MSVETDLKENYLDDVMIDFTSISEGDDDIERLEQAGSVVEPENYEKRLRVLIYQLPVTIVDTIKEYGIWTPGLSRLMDAK